MDVLATIFSFIKFLLLAFLASIVLLAVLAIVVSLLPKDNPLRALLTALMRPIGIMVAATMIAFPIEPIPLIDVLYDLAATGFIVYAWLQFIGEARNILPQLARSMAARAPAGDAKLSAADYVARGHAAFQTGAYGEALRWFRLAAERGYSGAQKLADEARARAEETARQDGQERQRQQEDTRRQASDSPMTRAHALEVLELHEGATREEVQAAYARLMKKVHPDVGGSTFFAKQLNEARDVLLG
jgi:hypothetical protein